MGELGFFCNVVIHLVILLWLIMLLLLLLLILLMLIELLLLLLRFGSTIRHHHRWMDMVRLWLIQRHDSLLLVHLLVHLGMLLRRIHLPLRNVAHHPVPVPIPIHVTIPVVMAILRLLVHRWRPRRAHGVLRVRML